METNNVLHHGILFTSWISKWYRLAVSASTEKYLKNRYQYFYQISADTDTGRYIGGNPSYECLMGKDLKVPYVANVKLDLTFLALPFYGK